MVGMECIIMKKLPGSKWWADDKKITCFELPFTGWSSLVVYSLSSSSSSPIYADRERGCVLPIHCHCTKNTFGLKKKTHETKPIENIYKIN